MQGILTNRNLWLSHVTSFNDPQEIEYGKGIVVGVLREFLRRENNQDVRDFLSAILPSVHSFGKSTHHVFLTCFCEDGNLLSQWRGYAEQGLGYSLGFDFSDATLATQYAASVEELATAERPYLRKIIYDPAIQSQLVEDYLEDAVRAVHTYLNRGPALSFGAGIAVSIAFQAANILFEMMLCFKHRAFSEENEWRLFRATRDDHQRNAVKFRESGPNLVVCHS